MAKEFRQRSINEVRSTYQTQKNAAVAELKKTSGDPLARILRKWAKDNRIKSKIMVCSSDEVPMGKGTTIASCSFVPPSAGLLITSYVINDIIK